MLAELDGVTQWLLALFLEQRELKALTRPSATLSLRERAFFAPSP
ncbi:MAG: hypothetical protein QW358_04165 [Candidatus Hadarchaeum sp.]